MSVVARDVVVGRVYIVDHDEHYPTQTEEMLVCIASESHFAMRTITWLWLLGPDAGSVFVGHPCSTNQMIGVSEAV